MGLENTILPLPDIDRLAGFYPEESDASVVFEGALPLGTWSRDVLLSEELGQDLAASDSLRLVLEVDEDAGIPEGIQGLGAGLIALAVV